ncbi:MAG: hypothetical protein ACOYD0_08480 [Candidatus Nanopelagicales bacterium]
MAIFRRQLAYAQSGSRAESEFALQRILRAERMTGWRSNDEILAVDGRLGAKGMAPPFARFVKFTAIRLLC